MPGNYFILEAEIGLSVSFMCYLPIKSKTVVTPDALSLHICTQDARDRYAAHLTENSITQFLPSAEG